MSETRNIVVLGASFGGLSAAHYAAKHILPRLQQAKDATYKLHLVDPSTHFWWHIAAPREIVSVKEVKHEQAFVPIMDGFRQYSTLKDSIIFHQGTATRLDAQSRTVTIQTHLGGEETLQYYALVIATGIRSPTPLTTLHGDHTISQRALEEMNVKLASAKNIVISGGGPVGVETAGEIATHLNKGKANITLIAGADKILPVLSKARAEKAAKMLEKLGVKIVYNVKVTGSEQSSDGQTLLRLDNGKTMDADVYIPAFGVKPNAEYVPDDLKASNGYIKTNPTTLRVDGAGPRVYAAGDIAGVDKGGVINLFSSLPVLGANMAHDLLTEAQVGNAPAEKSYKRKDAETQVVPIGAKTGVGAFNGFGLPAFAVSMAKGKDFMVSRMPGITEGKQWVKA